MNFSKDENFGGTRVSSSTKIGVFGVGYEKCGEQFPGLYDELIQKQEKFISKIPVSGIEVINFGIPSFCTRNRSLGSHFRENGPQFKY